MIEKEKIVSTAEDVFWAIELLKQGKSVYGKDKNY